MKLVAYVELQRMKLRFFLSEEYLETEGPSS